MKIVWCHDYLSNVKYPQCQKKKNNTLRCIQKDCLHIRFARWDIGKLFETRMCALRTENSLKASQYYKVT